MNWIDKKKLLLISLLGLAAIALIVSVNQLSNSNSSLASVDDSSVAICGTAATTYDVSDTEWGVANFCEPGHGMTNPIPSFPPVGKTVSWVCNIYIGSPTDREIYWAGKPALCKATHSSVPLDNPPPSSPKPIWHVNIFGLKKGGGVGVNFQW